jgi:hypothetical protein
MGTKILAKSRVVFVRKHSYCAFVLQFTTEYFLRPTKSVHLDSKICPTKSVLLLPRKPHLIKATLIPIKKACEEAHRANQMIN